MPAIEKGARIDLARREYGLTVDDLAGLIKHLPHDHENHRVRWAAWRMAIVLDQLMRAADGLAPDVYLPDVRQSERAALALAIDRWILDSGYLSLPNRVEALRYGLWLEEVTRAAVRHVRFVFDDGHWEHERSVPVAGDPFWCRGRLWAIQYATAEYDENNEIVHWTVCREREPPRGSIVL